jgi:predicted GNAT family acetyltransferase
MASGFATSEVDLAMPGAPQGPFESEAAPRVTALTNTDQEEILQFFSRRPIHTVCMSSYIRDHGVVSPLNRGLFYGHRNDSGDLTGVALIGHATLLETEDEAAIEAFAELTHRYPSSHLIRGEQELISRFWNHFENLGNSPRLACSELLFEQTHVVLPPDELPRLRLATLADLERVIQINAAMLFSECGLEPLKKDPIGFQNRIARRIKNRRVYVWERENQLLFKADIFAETPEMIYLEGINVHPRERGKGHGLRCMAQLGRLLLKRSKALCLLINKQQTALGQFYSKVGFEFRGNYQTVYLDTPNTQHQ